MTLCGNKYIATLIDYNYSYFSKLSTKTACSSFYLPHVSEWQANNGKLQTIKMIINNDQHVHHKHKTHDIDGW